MNELKNQMLRAIANNAATKVSTLTGEFVHAAPQEKEAILAGIDFERWLAETCEECLSNPEKC